MSTINKKWLAERPWVIAVSLAVVLVLWMASGAMQAKEAPDLKEQKHAPVAKVQVKQMQATPVPRTLTLYGRTQADRSISLNSEVRGKVLSVLAERGAAVTQGQVLVKLDPQDIPAQITSAEALLKQREIAYQGAKKLKTSGYQGEAQYAQAAADLAQAKANLARLQLDLANTQVKAPFTGVMNQRFVEVGNYVKSGDPIAEIVDLSPVVVKAFATEKQVNELTLGQLAEVKLINGHTTQGKLRYIASVADEKTNTFKLEIALASSDEKLAAGMSAEVAIELEPVPAIKLSPALLALDESGNIGVKTVVTNKVKFTPIDIVKSEVDGLWLAGLGTSPNVITLGQGFVRPGDAVEAVMAE